LRQGIPGGGKASRRAYKPKRPKKFPAAYICVYRRERLGTDALDVCLKNLSKGELPMPRGDKSKYKQECKADHIAGSYESRGVAQAESESDRGTVNKDDGAAKKSGSGRGKSAGRPEIRRAFVRKQVSHGEKNRSARKRHAAEAAHSYKI
jgi:hypothetical protein